MTGYSVYTAHMRAKRMRTQANQQHRRLHATHARRITELLRQYYSPDQARQAVGLSHATVYRWLWSQSKTFLQSMWRYLRHKKLRRKYGTKRREKQRELHKKRWIEQRHHTVNQCLLYRHWEGDTVRGNKHSG